VRRILNILLAFRDYVLFALLLISSITLIADSDSRQLRAIRTIAIGVVGYAQQALTAIPNVFALRRENETLRRLNVNLSEEVSRLREARLENDRLRAMLGLREEAPLDLVAADVVSKHLLLMRNTVTLNAGEAAGVAVDMPVIGVEGLVGKVIDTSPDFSIAQMLYNKDFRSSARVQRTRVDGILAWEGGSEMQLRNVLKTLDVRDGDVVITSEYSNVFPEGITIGTVSGVTQSAGSLFHDITVSPAVDFATLEHVFVVKVLPDSIRTTLEVEVPR
jgi:rod shape-determining protein MreC